MAEEYYLGELGSESMLSSVDRNVDENPERIKKDVRLASGKMVRDVIAVKRTFKFGYKKLPGKTSDVADDGMGRNDLRDLYDDGGELNLRVPLDVGGYDDVTVLFDGYSEKRASATPYYQWDLQFTLTEV